MIAPAIAAVAVFTVLFPVARQGFNFLDDGLWLAGAETVLRGKTLYGDLFTIYGPARFVTLALFLMLAGTSAATMAFLETLTTALAAGAGTFFVRRSGASRVWMLVPLATLALGVVKLKILVAGLFALIMGLALRRNLDMRQTIGLGTAAGVVAWFGLDAALNAAIIASVGIAVLSARQGRVAPPRLAAAACACAIVVLVPLLWALAAGVASDYLWGTIVYPVRHFHREMGISLIETLRDFEAIGQPFANLDTGEVLPGQWSAHATVRALAIRSLSVLVFLVPALSWILAWKRRDPLLASVAGFATAGLAGLITRGDELHLRDAALGTVWLSVAAIAMQPRRIAVPLAALFALACLPLIAETAWLAANARRESLRLWSLPRAGIYLAEERVQGLERGYAEIMRTNTTPTTFWPYQPGMNFLFDIPLAHRQVTLLGGEVRDSAALVDDLRHSPLPRIVLIQRFTLDGRTLRDLAPPLWGHLRSRYRVLDSIVDAPDPAWVLEPLGLGTIDSLPLDQRLPGQRAGVANGVSPDMAAGLRVSQSFLVDDLDLTGLRVRWLTDAIGVAVRVELVVWSVVDGRLEKPLRGFRTEVGFDRSPYTNLISFTPVAGTRGNIVAVELQLPDGAPASVRLFWHEHDGGRDDLFPGGSAYLDGVAVPADLYFESY